MATGVAGDERVGRVDDLRRRAVILFQPHRHRLRPARGELENVRDLRAAPGIDRLVVVPHDTEAAVIAGEGREDPLLNAAGVLVFVDEDVVEAPRLGEADILVLVEQLLDEHEEVVEVDRPGDAKIVLIAAVAGGGEGPVLWGVGREGLDGAVGADRGALPATHPVDEIAGGERCVGDFQLLEHLPRGRLLLAAVDDRKPLRVAEARGVAAEDADTEGVDRGDLGEILLGLSARAARHLLRLEIRLGAGHHLAGGFVGERHGEDPRRPRSAPHQMRHPSDDDARLPRAGPGEHQQRPDRRLDGLRLCRIEPRARARRRVRRSGCGAGPSVGGPGEGAEHRRAVSGGLVGALVGVLVWKVDRQVVRTPLRRREGRGGGGAKGLDVGVGGGGAGNVRRESVHVEKRPCRGVSGIARQSAGPDRTTCSRGHRSRSA